MSAVYQVTAECAYATVDTAYGRAKTLLYKGALITDATPELEHLLSGGMVVKVGGGDETGINAVGSLGVAETDQGAAGSVVSQTAPIAPVQAGGEQSEADVKAERVRADARAKLAEIGGTPDGRSSEAVWVEFAVANGTDRAEAEKAGKSELQKLYAKS